MGFLSGGNSSSSNTTNNYETNLTTTTTKDTGFQDSGGLFALAGDRNTVGVEILDGGAIKGAFDFAGESQAFYGDSFAKSLGFVERVNEDSLMAQGNIAGAFAAKNASDATGGVSALIMPLAFLAVGGFILYKVL